MSSTLSEESDEVAETLERLEVADTLESLRHHIDDLIARLSESQAPPTSAPNESNAVPPELEQQIENLGDKVESASHLLAELTDVLEAQSERIETIEQQIGDVDGPVFRHELRAAASELPLPSFSMTPPKRSVEAPPPITDPTLVLRDYLDARIDTLADGIRLLEHRLIEMRGMVEGRDRQARELEERLLILVDSSIQAGRERDRQALHGVAAQEKDSESPPRAGKEPQESRPAAMPYFAQLSAFAPRRVVRRAGLGAEATAGRPRRASVGAADELAGHFCVAQHQGTAVVPPAERHVHARLEVASETPANASRPRGEVEASMPPPQASDEAPSGRVAADVAAGAATAARTISVSATTATSTSAAAAAEPSDPALEPAPEPSAGEPEARSSTMREIERLVERDVKLRRDFSAGAIGTPRLGKSRPTVLVIDDAPDALTLLSIYLSKTGYQVVTACSAEDGLAKLRHHQIDAIVLDAKLPGASGAHVCRVLREDPAYAKRRSVPVIVYTGYPDDFPATVREQWHAAEYIVKGGDMLPLITALVRHTTAAESR